MPNISSFNLDTVEIVNAFALFDNYDSLVKEYSKWPKSVTTYCKILHCLLCSKIAIFKCEFIKGGHTMAPSQ